MGTPNTQEEMAEALYRRLENLHEEIEMMEMAVEALLRLRKIQPTSPFPISLLEQLVRSGLALLERSVARLVRSTKR